MRVIAGTYRSRQLIAPPGMATRPTSDRLRETLFNVLAPHIEGARFADLYAGTGAVGIEALSRGAAHVTFVESAASAIAALRANLTALNIRDGYLLEQRSVPLVLRNLARREPRFNLVYLDPPWDDASAYTEALTLLSEPGGTLLAPGAIVIAEHARPRSATPGSATPSSATPGSAMSAQTYGALERYRILQQGDAALSFYRRNSS